MREGINGNDEEPLFGKRQDGKHLMRLDLHLGQ